MTVAATAMMTAAGASNGARRPGETMTTPRTDAAYERFKVALQLPERDTDRAIVKAIAEIDDPTRRGSDQDRWYRECRFCQCSDYVGPLVHHERCLWQRAKKRLEDPQVMIQEMLDEHMQEVFALRERYLRTLLEEYFCRGIRDVRLVEDRSDPLKTKFYFEIPGVTE